MLLFVVPVVSYLCHYVCRQGSPGWRVNLCWPTIIFAKTNVKLWFLVVFTHFSFLIASSELSRSSVVGGGVVTLMETNPPTWSPLLVLTWYVCLPKPTKHLLFCSRQDKTCKTTIGFYSRRNESNALNLVLGKTYQFTLAKFYIAQRNVLKRQIFLPTAIKTGLC